MAMQSGETYQGGFSRFRAGERAAFCPGGRRMALRASAGVRARDVMVNVYNVNQVQIQLNLQLVFSLVL